MLLEEEYPSWKFALSEEAEIVPMLSADVLWPGARLLLIIKAERKGAKLLATGYSCDEVTQGIRTLLQGRPR